MKTTIRVFALILALTLTVTVLSSCNSADPFSTPGKLMTQSEYDEEYAKDPYNNTNRELRIAGGFWPAPPGFGGNLIGAQVGDPGYYIYESMFLCIRGTNEIIPRLAERAEHDGNITKVIFKQDRYWSDGTKFTAKDMWAYYILNGENSATTMHLDDLVLVDEYTLEFHWAEAMSETAKMLYLCDGWQAVTPYHIFGQYVDRNYELMQQGTKYAGGNVEERRKLSFGLEYDARTKRDFKANYNEFKGLRIPMPIGTGPYMVEDVTNSECVLMKNPYFPNKDELEFDRLRMINVADYNSLLSTNGCDSFIGTLAYDMTLNILQKSGQMAMYPILEAKCVGIIMNNNKEPLNDKIFRQALNFVVDKKTIREIGNYWAQESDIATTGILPSTIDEFVEKDVAGQIQRYSTDHAKAEELLKSIGWTKNGNKWVDKDGKSFKFVIAANGGWGTQGINVATEFARQLTDFGFETTAKAQEATVVVANMKAGEYDMLVDFVDMTWDKTEPFKCFGAYYGDITEKCGIDLSTYMLTDQNGESFNPKELTDSLKYITDPAEYKKQVSRLTWATNDAAIAINLYQNVMCIWENYHTQKGLPMEKEIDYFHGSMPLPRTYEEYVEVAMLNRDYAFYAEKFINSPLKAR